MTGESPKTLLDWVRNELRKETLGKKTIAHHCSGTIGQSADNAQTKVVGVPGGLIGEQAGRLVFVSYATPDLDYALAIVTAFEEYGLKCWIAPRDISPGKNFNAEIVRAIDRCTDLILLFSANSNDSKHVKRELYLWLEHSKPIVPVRMDDARPSDEFRYLLAGMQWATATDGRALLRLFSA